ncbi:Zinc finger MYM-type protein 6 [Thelohanellus kitauei]|uniref:Zinc finger MYM-type protein 6 n=1 Tax=Thelohanellus kitauei TaxID=669202 RepID=A0A0C2M669_THEKT|nr:Zinc finger MYM-type protein 6 [Thelohanellus kitauei]
MDKYLKRKAYQNLEDSKNIGAKDELKRKRRKYDPQYISLGVSTVGSDDDPPLCVVCLQKLSNESMKPAKLKRHFTTMHSELISKPKHYFERQKELYLKQKSKLMFCTTLNEKVLRESTFQKPHTIAEELILPSAIDMCEVVLRSNYSQKLKAITLSDNTVSRRIVDMSEDVLCQLIARLQNSKFEIQLDESLDIANASQLLVYVRYCWEGRTTGEDLFRTQDLPGHNCVGVGTDGAAVMTGSKSGLAARVKQAAPHIVSTQ